jgi:hypothetical protein
VNFFYQKPASPVLSKGGASRPPGGWPRLSKGGASLSPRIGGSPPAVVTTQEAPVAKEAAAAKASAAKAAVAKAAVAEAATEPAVVTEATTAAEAAVTEASAAKAAVAKAAVAEAVATPGRRGDVHRADYSRYRRRRGGVSCGGSTEKHCAGHRACADCAGGDPAGRRE